MGAWLQFVVGAAWAATLAVWDVRTRRLPNALTLGGLGVALVLALGHGAAQTAGSLATGFWTTLFILPLFLLRATGAGDVKMMAAAGVFAGPGRAIEFLLALSIAGFLLAVAMLLLRRVDPARLKHLLRCVFDFTYDRRAGRAALPPRTSEACRVPFAVAVAAALAWCLLTEAV